ncbi:MAG: NFACT family protein [Clostridia bacterium]|nr:NFACT family protein [Clostridia bacterium]
MAMDGVSVAALVKELNTELSGLRVDKIQQTETDELMIGFYGGAGGSKKIRLTSNSQVARVCLTDDRKKSPEVAPLFCMLLRKHLGGAKFREAVQPDFERIIKLVFEGSNEFGDSCEKYLIAELMGRHSNIILVDENKKIIDSIKHIDFSVSSVRQVLPGLMYQYPPSQEKTNPLTVGLNEIVEKLQSGIERADYAVMNAFSGISPLVSREIVYRAFGTHDIYMEELDYSKLLDLAAVCFEIFSKIKEGKFSPCYLVRNDTGKPFEFAAIDIRQYEDASEVIPQNSMSQATEDFYREKDKIERLAHKSARLVKIVGNNIDRCAKKLINQKADLADTENMERYRRYAELITANLYALKENDTEAVVVDYYDEEMPQITIKLDGRFSPAVNAQKFFKKYTKAKTAREELKKQIKIASAELNYLESVEEELKKAETEADLSEVADELFEQGYIRRPKEVKRKKKETQKPMEFETPDGFRVLVGKNNKQNDLLTLKLSKNSDMWFHTKDIHGSHVVLCYEYGREFSDTAILYAATLAAKYSKASESSQVPVDYTLVKYVKKPSGAAPGMVIYTDNKTVYVTPEK